MAGRGKLEVAGVVAALLLCGAFLTSFILGLRARPRAVDVEQAPAAVNTIPAGGQLEVLNASGRTGMARTATDRLRAAGFDVVFFGNAPASMGDSSVVIARTANERVARDAARAIGIGRVTTTLDSTLYLDASVIIGRDWPPQEERREAAAPDGWKSRLKRWLSPG